MPRRGARSGGPAAWPLKQLYVERRWGPLTPPAAARTLIDETGHFYSLERIPEFLAQPDLATIQPGGVAVRQTDYDFWTSPAAQAIVQEEGIILLDYRPLQAAWRA